MKYIKVIVSIGIISLLLFFSAMSDYKWADLIVKQETPKGWVIVYKQNNFMDLTLPWTWIKTPVTGLWFIKDTHTQKLNQDIYLIHTLRVSYDYSRTERDESFEIVNIKTSESAFIDTDQDLSTLNVNNLKWYKFDSDTPGNQIIQYMVKYYEENS